MVRGRKKGRKEERKKRKEERKKERKKERKNCLDINMRKKSLNIKRSQRIVDKGSLRIEHQKAFKICLLRFSKLNDVVQVFMICHP
jgi:hypothetical protein